MSQPCHLKASRFATWLARLASLVFFLLSLGYLLHTSLDPVVFGKYDVEYCVFLAVVFLIFVPGFHFLARFCAVPHELRSRSGMSFVVRPRHKLAVVAIGGGIAYLSALAYADRLIHSRTMTIGGDVFHPYLQNTPLPNDAAQHINRWGFRGDDLDQDKSDNTFRIFMFGGSTVYCGTMPYEDTHCRILERRLRQAYPQHQIEVQNLGADWHATEHDIIKLLFYGQDFSPDLVITFHAINDLVRSLSPDMFGDGPYRSDYRHYLGAAANMVTGGRKIPWTLGVGYWCSDVLFDQIRIAGPEGQGLAGVRTCFVPKALDVEVEWKSLPAFRRNLRDFVTIARSKGAQVLLATQPSLYREDLTPSERQLLVFQLMHHFHGKRPSLHSMIDGMSRFNTATGRLAEELSVDLVDLEQRMPKATDYMYDDVHYTKAGNLLVADAFTEAIVESKMIDRVMERRAKDRGASN